MALTVVLLQSHRGGGGGGGGGGAGAIDTASLQLEIAVLKDRLSQVVGRCSPRCAREHALTRRAQQAAQVHERPASDSAPAPGSEQVAELQRQLAAARDAQEAALAALDQQRRLSQVGRGARAARDWRSEGA